MQCLVKAYKKVVIVEVDTGKGGSVGSDTNGDNGSGSRIMGCRINPAFPVTCSCR